VACSGSQSAWHAERLAVPRNLVVPIPAGVALDAAAFVTLGAIATEACRKSGLHFGETLAVTGVGLLGLLATQIARSAGYYVFAIDIDDGRLNTARGVGANWSANPLRDDVAALVRAETAGFGADGVLLTVATESSEPFNQAFDIVRQRGTVVAVGQFGMNIERQRWFHNEANLVVVLAYGPGRYDPVYEEGNVDLPIGLVRWTENRNMAHFLRLLAEGAVDLQPIAPRRFPVEQAPDAYALLMSSERPPTVMFSYGSNVSSG
jgi:threonine dehydrogenase-like Zn-dependent dehydrogenase